MNKDFSEATAKDQWWLFGTGSNPLIIYINRLSGPS
jgi:hypothetical protein